MKTTKRFIALALSLLLTLSTANSIAFAQSPTEETTTPDVVDSGIPPENSSTGINFGNTAYILSSSKSDDHYAPHIVWDHQMRTLFINNTDIIYTGTGSAITVPTASVLVISGESVIDLAGASKAALAVSVDDGDKQNNKATLSIESGSKDAQLTIKSGAENKERILLAGASREEPLDTLSVQNIQVRTDGLLLANQAKANHASIGYLPMNVITAQGSENSLLYKIDKEDVLIQLIPENNGKFIPKQELYIGEEEILSIPRGVTLDLTHAQSSMVTNQGNIYLSGTLLADEGAIQGEGQIFEMKTIDLTNTQDNQEGEDFFGNPWGWDATQKILTIESTQFKRWDRPVFSLVPDSVVKYTGDCLFSGNTNPFHFTGELTIQCIPTDGEDAKKPDTLQLETLTLLEEQTMTIAQGTEVLLASPSVQVVNEGGTLVNKGKISLAEQTTLLVQGEFLNGGVFEGEIDSASEGVIVGLEDVDLQKLLEDTDYLETLGWQWTDDTKTLTLKGSNSPDTGFIMPVEETIILVEGTNTIGRIWDTGNAYTKIIGAADASLITGDIVLTGDLSIENCTLDIGNVLSKNSTFIRSSGRIGKEDATLAAISARENISFEGCEILGDFAYMEQEMEANLYHTFGKDQSPVQQLELALREQNAVIVLEEISSKSYDRRAIEPVIQITSLDGTPIEPLPEAEFVYKWYQKQDKETWNPLGEATPIDVGEYKLEVSLKHPLYDAAPQTMQFAITPRDVDITAVDQIIYVALENLPEIPVVFSGLPDGTFASAEEQETYMAMLAAYRTEIWSNAQLTNVGLLGMGTYTVLVVEPKDPDKQITHPNYNFHVRNAKMLAYNLENSNRSTMKDGILVKEFATAGQIAMLDVAISSSAQIEKSFAQIPSNARKYININLVAPSLNNLAAGDAVTTIPYREMVGATKHDLFFIAYIKTDGSVHQITDAEILKDEDGISFSVDGSYPLVIGWQPTVKIVPTSLRHNGNLLYKQIKYTRI